MVDSFWKALAAGGDGTCCGCVPGWPCPMFLLGRSKCRRRNWATQLISKAQLPWAHASEEIRQSLSKERCCGARASIHLSQGRWCWRCGLMHALQLLLWYPFDAIWHLGNGHPCYTESLLPWSTLWLQDAGRNWSLNHRRSAQSRVRHDGPRIPTPQTSSELQIVRACRSGHRSTFAATESSYPMLRISVRRIVLRICS